MPKIIKGDNLIDCCETHNRLIEIAKITENQTTSELLAMLVWIHDVGYEDNFFLYVRQYAEGLEKTFIGKTFRRKEC